MKELELVVLRRSVPEHGLMPGDVGTIVHDYGNGSAYEVEFVLASGDTVAVLTLSREDIREREGSEILHSRPVA